jgi:hypothetical protein
MRTEPITTHDIKVGDRIASHGMVLLVDIEPHQTRHPVDNEGGITLATSAVIENWADLVVASNADRYSNERYIVNLADKSPDGIARWTIQGNGWARWARII